MKALLALGVAVVLTGCGLAGSAASIGSARISDAQLNTEVSQVLAAQGRSADAEDAELIRQVLERLVVTELVDQIATEEGVAVTNGEIERLAGGYVEQFGGEEAFEQALAQQGIAPEQAAGFLRLNAQLNALRESVGNDDEAFFALVTRYADASNVEVSPRYGAWDPSALVVNPPEDLLSVER